MGSTREGLVEHDEFWVYGEGSRDLRPASLAAGELDALAFADVAESKFGYELFEAGELVFLGVVGHFEDAEDVVFDA